jgi:hypothetical protein
VKELRLQHSTVLVASLYVVGWILVSLVGGNSPEARYAFWNGTLMYQLVVTMMAGSLASAEERRSGTLSWQTLQPYPMWKQWTIKVVTTMLLVLLLVVALPQMLTTFSLHADKVGIFAFVRTYSVYWVFGMGMQWTVLAGLLVLTAAALFTSSFCRNSLHALFATALLTAGCIVAVLFGFIASGRAVWNALDLATVFNPRTRAQAEALRQAWTMDDFLWVDRVAFASVLVMMVVGLFVLVSLGLRNHRAAETPRPVVTRQVLSVLAYAVIAGGVVGGGLPLAQWYLATH